MKADEVSDYLNKVSGWSSLEDKRIEKKFNFKDFIEAMKFVNKLADLAEEQGHHPDFCVHYNEVKVTLWTHKIDGLHENDFIMASKIDEL